MNLPTLVHIEVKVKWILNLFMKWEWIEHFRDISRNSANIQAISNENVAWVEMPPNNQINMSWLEEGIE